MITIGFFASVAIGGYRKRIRCQREAYQEVNVVTRDELLRQALGDVRCRTGRVFLHDLDLLAGDRIAVLLHIRLLGVTAACSHWSCSHRTQRIARSATSNGSATT